MISKQQVATRLFGLTKWQLVSEIFQAYPNQFRVTLRCIAMPNPANASIGEERLFMVMEKDNGLTAYEAKPHSPVFKLQ